MAEGEKLAELAQRSGLVLMCGHTYCYTPAVQRIRQLIRGGEIGDIQFVDSVRINLGLAEEFPTGEQHHPYANDTLYGRPRPSMKACCAVSTRCGIWTT